MSDNTSDNMSNIRHFLDIDAVDRGSIERILSRSSELKTARAGKPRGTVDEGRPLDGHVLAMIFEKPSTRTRVSFEMSIRQLGGTALMLSGRDSQLGRGETVADTARVLSRYVDAIRNTGVEFWLDMYQGTWFTGGGPEEDLRIARRLASQGVDGGVFYYWACRPVEWEQANWQLKLLDVPDVTVDPHHPQLGKVD